MAAECHLRELFSQKKSFFTKKYPNHYAPTALPDHLKNLIAKKYHPFPSSLPDQLKNLISRYLLSPIRIARIAHGQAEDTLSYILKQADLSLGTKKLL